MTLQLDAQRHELLALTLRQWVAEHTGSRIAADVVTGSGSRRVADGLIVTIDEHPVSKGVYRIVFDSHVDSGAEPDSITFGFEVTDVRAGPATLDIQKGTAQRITLTDVARQQAVAARAAAMPQPLPSLPVPAPKQRTAPLARWRLLIYLLAAVAVAFAAFVLLRSEGPEPEQTVPTNPAAAFSVAERRLLQHVPWPVQACRPATDSAARGVVASVVCRPAGEQTRIRYSRYPAQARLQSTWDAMRKRINSAGSGTTDREYGTWCTIAIGECRISDGFSVLYRDKGLATAQWTHTELRILAWAQRPDGRLNALRALWQQAGPVE